MMLPNSISKSMDLSDNTAFFKFTGLDEDRVQIELCEYRFPQPIKVGVIVNLEGQDFDAFSVQYFMSSLVVQLVNYIKNMANTN